MIYDVAIIGTGPAGVSAALNLKIHEKKVIWFGNKNLSDKVTKAERISNYPGMLHATGIELNDAFKQQVEEMNMEITEQMVNSIVPFGEHYAIMAGSDFYEAKSIILASGIANIATFPQEAELVGKGISYCATCDGGLYRGKIIGVICNNARFEHEVEYLADLAEKIYYFPQYKDVRIHRDNVEIRNERIKGFIGGDRLDGIELRSGNHLKVDGVFCLRDSVALATLLPEVATEKGHIVVNRSMATNLPGVYAAGDCTGRPYQYAKAVGEGNVAAHSVIEYLAERM